MIHSAAHRALALVSALALLIFGALPAFADSFDITVNSTRKEITWTDLQEKEAFSFFSQKIDIDAGSIGTTVYLKIPSIVHARAYAYTCTFYNKNNAGYDFKLNFNGSWSSSTINDFNISIEQFESDFFLVSINFTRTYTFKFFQISIGRSNGQTNSFNQCFDEGFFPAFGIGEDVSFTASKDFIDSTFYAIYPYSTIGSTYGGYKIDITTEYLYNVVDFYSYDQLQHEWFDDELYSCFIFEDIVNVDPNTSYDLLTLSSEGMQLSDGAEISGKNQLHRYRFKNVPAGSYAVEALIYFNNVLPGPTVADDLIYPALIVIDDTINGLEDAWEQIYNDYVAEEITIDQAISRIKTLLKSSVSISESWCEKVYWISYADLIQDRINASETFKIYQLITAVLDQIAADVETIRTSDASLAASLDARLAAILAALGSSGSSQTQILQTVTAISAELTTVDPEDREAVEDLREKMDDIRDQIAETSPAESALESRISAVTVPEFDMTSVKAQISDVGDLADGLGSITQSIFALPKIGIVLLLGGVAFYVRKIMKHASK